MIIENQRVMIAMRTCVLPESTPVSSITAASAAPNPAFPDCVSIRNMFAHAQRVLPVGLGRGGALDQMVAVDGGWHQSLGQAGRDELEHSHLSSGILHAHAVYGQQQQHGKVGPSSQVMEL